MYREGLKCPDGGRGGQGVVGAVGVAVRPANCGLHRTVHVPTVNTAVGKLDNWPLLNIFSLCLLRQF